MSWRWLTQRGYRVTFALAALFVIYHAVNELRVLGGGPTTLLQRLELTALDVKFAFRGARTPDSWRVVVAAIDEQALQRFGPLPWDRTIHAQLVERLTELDAGAIAFDMTFDRPSSSRERAAYRALAQEFRAAGLSTAAARLRKAAARVRRPKRSRRRRRRRPAREARALAKQAADLATQTRRVASSLERFDGVLSAQARIQDSDTVFARAIEDSGRVVLGAVAYSKREADALAATGGAGRGLTRIASSTIAALAVDDGSGLTRLVDGRGHFQSVFYRRYFDLQAPTPRLAAATPHFGLINAAPDPDGVNRRMPLVSTIKGSGVVVPSLALKAAEVVQSAEIEIVGDPESPAPDLIRLGSLAIDTELGATTTLDWLSAFDPATFPIVSVVDVVDRKVAPELIRGRAVFIAATAVGTHDQRVTPTEPAVPGVYIHATLAQNILEGRQLSRPAYIVLLELVILLTVGLVTGLVMARFRLWGQVATAGVLAVGWLAISQALFLQGLVVVTVLPVALVFASLLAMSMWSYLVEQRERRMTRRAFAQYLSPGVLERVLAEPEEYLKLGGRRYDATVLFSDIRGFTTISEALTPEELGRLLNEYMTPMTNIVFKHQGTLDKYIGDAVMAFWGAPVEQSDHPVRACRAALEMQAEVAELNRRFTVEGLPNIAIGIGLSTGPMTIGNMGSDDHFAYTALGDRVNLGARLEGQTKEYGVKIMISDATYKRVADEMLCRELGSIRVKGKSEPVRIYELVGPRQENKGRETFVDTFHQALTLFRERKWDAAMGQFTTARALGGVHGDKTSDLYIQWCMEFKQNPPPDDWDGVRVATHK